MTDNDEIDLEHRVRTTLSIVAQSTPSAIGRMQQADLTVRRARTASLVAAALVGVAISGAAIVNMRWNENPAAGQPGSSTPLASSPSPGATAAAEGSVATPPPGSPGLSVSPVEPDAFTRRVPNSWSAVVKSAAGSLIFLQNRQGGSLVPPGPSEQAEVGEILVTSWEENDLMRAYTFPVGCTDIEVRISADDVDHGPWQGDAYDLIEATHIEADGGVEVVLPSGWTSYGVGELGPSLELSFTMLVDNVPTQLRSLQTFDTQPGATVRSGAYVPSTVNGQPALVLSRGGTSIVTFGLGDDTISLSGAVSVDDLIPIAESMGHFGVVEAPDELLADLSAGQHSPPCPLAVTSH